MICGVGNRNNKRPLFTLLFVIIAVVRWSPDKVFILEIRNADRGKSGTIVVGGGL